MQIIKKPRKKGYNSNFQIFLILILIYRFRLKKGYCERTPILQRPTHKNLYFENHLRLRYKYELPG